MYSLCIFPRPILTPPYPRGSRFKQTEFYTTLWCFHTCNSLPGQLVCWEDFLKLSKKFHSISTIFPWKRAWPFVITNLSPLYRIMHCAKFGWNMPRGSGEKVENIKCLKTARETDGQTDVLQTKNNQKSWNQQYWVRHCIRRKILYYTRRQMNMYSAKR